MSWRNLISIVTVVAGLSAANGAQAATPALTGVLIDKITKAGIEAFVDLYRCERVTDEVCTDYTDTLASAVDGSYSFDPSLNPAGRYQIRAYPFVGDYAATYSKIADVDPAFDTAFPITRAALKRVTIGPVTYSGSTAPGQTLFMTWSVTNNQEKVNFVQAFTEVDAFDINTGDGFSYVQTSAGGSADPQSLRILPFSSVSVTHSLLIPEHSERGARLTVFPQVTGIISRVNNFDFGNFDSLAIGEPLPLAPRPNSAEAREFVKAKAEKRHNEMLRRAGDR